MSNREYKEGDLVKHTSRYLRSIAWFTNVPHNGRVTGVDMELVTVHWSDGHENRIHVANIMPAGQPDTDA